MAQGRKTGSAAAQPSGTSERQKPPRLPEPEERTGDRTADALLDLRAHAAATRASVAATRASMDAISAERLSEAVQGAVRADTAAVVQDLHKAARNASQAATAAQEAAEEAHEAASESRSGIAPGRAFAIALCAACGGFLAALPAGVYVQLAYIEAILTRLDLIVGFGAGLALSAIIAALWPRSDR